jgi:hypothetical protein
MFHDRLDIEEGEENQPDVGCPAVVAIVGKKSHVAVYILTLPDSKVERNGFGLWLVPGGS